MTNDAWIVLLGTVGGFCTTFAYVPQVIKIWKQGGRDLSYAMLSLYLVGVMPVARLRIADPRASGGHHQLRDRHPDRRSPPD